MQSDSNYSSKVQIRNTNTGLKVVVVPVTLLLSSNFFFCCSSGNLAEVLAQIDKEWEEEEVSTVKQ